MCHVVKLALIYATNLQLIIFKFFVVVVVVFYRKILKTCTFTQLIKIYLSMINCLVHHLCASPCMILYKDATSITQNSTCCACDFKLDSLTLNTHAVED